MHATDQGPSVLCRALGTLGRGAADGVLHIRADGGRSASITLNRGRIEAIGVDGHEGILGDLLLDDGSRADALVDDAGRAPGEPIGAFLVRTGRVDAATLSHALRSQSRKRLRELFAWKSIVVRFSRRPSRETTDELPTMDDSIVDALRATAPDVGPAELLRELGRERLVLTASASEWLKRAALRPEETAVVVYAGHGLEADSLVGLDRRALRFAVALKRVGAIEVPRATGRYSLLLRKHHELRRSKDASTLLGVTPGADAAETRRALRNLARELHPDRFHAGRDAAARNVSAEVLKALVRAEDELARDDRRGRAK